jgi:hypothetical protein
MRVYRHSLVSRLGSFGLAACFLAVPLVVEELELLWIAVPLATGLFAWMSWQVVIDPDRLQVQMWLLPFFRWNRQVRWKDVVQVTAFQNPLFAEGDGIAIAARTEGGQQQRILVAFGSLVARDELLGDCAKYLPQDIVAADTISWARSAAHTPRWQILLGMATIVALSLYLFFVS